MFIKGAMRSPIFVICMDGLDPDFSKEVGCSLPYECELSIPTECYEDGYPWTPHVWGSMFTGRIEKYPNSFIIKKGREKTFWMDRVRILHKKAKKKSLK